MVIRAVEAKQKHNLQLADQKSKQYNICIEDQILYQLNYCSISTNKLKLLKIKICIL